MNQAGESQAGRSLKDLSLLDLLRREFARPERIAIDPGDWLEEALGALGLSREGSGEPGAPRAAPSFGPELAADLAAARHARLIQAQRAGLSPEDLRAWLEETAVQARTDITAARVWEAVRAIRLTPTAWTLNELSGVSPVGREALWTVEALSEALHELLPVVMPRRVRIETLSVPTHAALSQMLRTPDRAIIAGLWGRRRHLAMLTALWQIGPHARRMLRRQLQGQPESSDFSVRLEFTLRGEPNVNEVAWIRSLGAMSPEMLGEVRDELSRYRQSAVTSLYTGSSPHSSYRTSVNFQGLGSEGISAPRWNVVIGALEPAMTAEQWSVLSDIGALLRAPITTDRVWSASGTQTNTESVQSVARARTKYERAAARCGAPLLRLFRPHAPEPHAPEPHEADSTDWAADIGAHGEEQ